MIERFDLADVGHSAAVFDVGKLAWVNRHYMKETETPALAKLALPYFIKAGYVSEPTPSAEAYLAALLPMAAGSVDRIEEIPARVAFVFDWTAESAAAIVRDDPQGGPAVAAMADEIAAAGPLDKDRFRAAAARVRERIGLKGRALFHPIRLALTAAESGPELDLAVPAIDRGAALGSTDGPAPHFVLCRALEGCRSGTALRRRGYVAPPHIPMSLIYGIHSVSEALKARRVTRLVHERGAGARVDELVARAHELRIVIETLDPRALDKLTRGGVHQGVAAELQRLPAYTLEELVAEAVGPPLLIVLDGIEDPHNVGAIVRSVDASGADGLVRQARHAAPLDGATAKASAGAVTHVRIATVVNIARSIEELKALNVWTIGLDAAATETYDVVDYTQPTAFVLGAEGTGLRRLVRESCDRLVSIPMAGEVSSLNVSVSAGIALFEAARQRRAAAAHAAR